jgi:hypothetical protein
MAVTFGGQANQVSAPTRIFEGKKTKIEKKYQITILSNKNI